jgi:S-formylglutathione hydrolase
MYDYVVSELPELIEAEFSVNGMRSISGHSMGGHGAITIGLKNPDKYRSISAFSPISNPVNCPWGQKALGLYLGDDQEAWAAYDSSELLRRATEQLPLLVDQGLADNFLTEQLRPETLDDAATESGYRMTLRRQPGYDHSYFFISTFIEDHLRFHAQHLI